MQCPNCDLENPPGAKRCDCGFDFDARQMKEPYVGPPSSNLKSNFIFGRMFAVEGKVIDIVATLGVIACVVLTARLRSFGFGFTAGPLLALTIGSVMKLTGDKSMSIIRCMFWCSMVVLLFIVFAAFFAGI